MGMPVILKVVDSAARSEDFAAVFDYFKYVDDKFSTYKPNSGIMRINRGEIGQKDWNGDMQEIFTLAEDTRAISRGYFDIKKPDGSYDPSGIVKGWAILGAANIFRKRGFGNFYVDAGGAGGIGITPFRSMVKYLNDNNERRDIVLLYIQTILPPI